jgi:orotidine-5'-phosphate decarboxylase
LKEQDKRIFLDLKFHDIPNTVMSACRSASQYGVDLLTIHATAGRSALKLAAEAMHQSQSPTKLVAITLLTSLISRDLAFDLKVPLELPDYVLQMALLAQESGIHGAVCSPQEVSQLREICGPDFLLICPGVRPSWSITGDQRRVMTPAAAIAAGADYLVIGRPITAAPSPQDAWEKICQEIA